MKIFEKRINNLYKRSLSNIRFIMWCINGYLYSD